MLSDERLRAVKVVAIGASAGGLEALKRILPRLPPRFAPPVVVVMHVSSSRPSLLVDVFAPNCALPVREPLDKEPMRRGIWFAPSGYHVLTEGGRAFAMSVEEPVQYSRPSIDVLFESVARDFGSTALAVVLTGANADGAAGVADVLRAGGLALAQDPDTAVMPMMPRAAIAAGALPLSIDDILRVLLRVDEKTA